MTRNQWIGLGCGGAGCLGLIVVMVAAGVAFYLYKKPTERTYDYSSNSNRSSNTNANRNTNSNSNSDSSTTMSNDDRHKLFQAASVTHDRELIKQVNEKLGLLDAEGVPGKKYAEFARDHIVWIFSNTEWLQEVNSEEKARAYVEEHLDD